MKILIVVATLVALASSQTQQYQRYSQRGSFINTGTFSYTDETGKIVHITYVEDENGMRITSHKYPPEQEKRIIQQIKEHNIKLQQQLNQQLSQLNHQLTQQFNQLNQQFQQTFSNPFLGFGGRAAAGPNYNPFGPGFPFYGGFHFRKRRSVSDY